MRRDLITKVERIWATKHEFSNGLGIKNIHVYFQFLALFLEMLEN